VKFTSLLPFFFGRRWLDLLGRQIFVRNTKPLLLGLGRGTLGIGGKYERAVGLIISIIRVYILLLTTLRLYPQWKLTTTTVDLKIQKSK